MTYFDRTRVSPTDLVWDQSVAPPEKGPPPLWSALTHPVLAPPPGAKPFYLAGSFSSQVTPFTNAAVPSCDLVINIGDVCVLKSLYVAFDVTLNPVDQRYWSLALNGAPVGFGFGSARTFNTGWSTTNGVVFWPLDLRITTAGTLTLTVTDTADAGTVRTFSGIMAGWLYPATFDKNIEQGA